MEELRATHSKCRPEGPGCGWHTCHECYCFNVEGFGLAESAHVGGPQEGDSRALGASCQGRAEGPSLRSKRTLYMGNAHELGSPAGTTGIDDAADNQCGQCGRDVSTCTCDFGV